MSLSVSFFVSLSLSVSVSLCLCLCLCFCLCLSLCVSLSVCLSLSLSLCRAQELCESGGGRPGLPVPNSSHGLCGRKSTLNRTISVSGQTGSRRTASLADLRLSLRVDSGGLTDAIKKIPAFRDLPPTCGQSGCRHLSTLCSVIARSFIEWPCPKPIVSVLRTSTVHN